MNLDALCRETRSRQHELLDEASRGRLNRTSTLKPFVVGALLIGAPTVFALLNTAPKIW